VLNTTPAMAEDITAQTADAYAPQAATRPLAGFGAGAFVCAGAWPASGINELAAALALPRIKPFVAASDLAGAVAAAGMTSFVDVVQVDSVQRDAHNFIQTTRLYSATPGGVGPHPAREPVPV
jgi:hypothetical protein